MNSDVKLATLVDNPPDTCEEILYALDELETTKVDSQFLDLLHFYEKHVRNKCLWEDRCPGEVEIKVLNQIITLRSRANSILYSAIKTKENYDN